jgi:hypothetical protein
MTYEDLKKLVLEVAAEYASRGYGYAQESVVLREVAARVGAQTSEQNVLTVWHDLFREGALSWGIDLDNPSWPFFHVPQRGEPAVAELAGVASRP